MFATPFLCIKRGVWGKLVGMKTVVIVGASSGIGRETADLFLQEKYKVLNLSRSPCPLPGVENLPCDVTVREQVDAALSKLADEDVAYFVYSAGFSMAAPLEFVREEDYRYLFEVNFFAFLRFLQALLPSLQRNAGTACVVGSLASCVPIAFDAYYTASKAALNAFVAALSLELDPDLVRVVCVLPGGTKTGFTDKRKVYAPAETNGYGKLLRLATDALARTEQKGSDPKKVAKTVVNACLFPSHIVVTSGLKNKLYRLFARLCPEKAFTSLLKTVYYTEQTDE